MRVESIFFLIYIILATMQRLISLRLMTLHTHLYTKLDEFGKDYDVAHKTRVKDECPHLNLLFSQSTSNITPVLPLIHLWNNFEYFLPR